MPVPVPLRRPPSRQSPACLPAVSAAGVYPRTRSDARLPACLRRWALPPREQIALAQIEQALAAGIPRARCSWMLATVMRRRCAIGSARNELSYAVALRPATTVWWGEHQPAPVARMHRRGGRPRTRVRRDSEAPADRRARSGARAADGRAGARSNGGRGPTRRSPRALHGCAAVPHTAIFPARKNGCSSNGRTGTPRRPTPSCPTCLNRSRLKTW